MYLVTLRVNEVIYFPRKFLLDSHKLKILEARSCIEAGGVVLWGTQFLDVLSLPNNKLRPVMFRGDNKKRRG